MRELEEQLVLVPYLHEREENLTIEIKTLQQKLVAARHDLAMLQLQQDSKKEKEIFLTVSTSQLENLVEMVLSRVQH